MIVTAAIAGLGGRGRRTYGVYAENAADKLKIVAVADIVKERADEAAETFGVGRDNCFYSAAELLKREKLADALFVCTPDENHYETAMAALDKGYHLLLEKPIATSAAQCAEIAAKAKEKGLSVAVCHVLRYSPFYAKIKEIIDSGVLGEIVTINAVENVGYFHQAHSFVRGNWRNEAESNPMILAKCCHDLDLLVWLSGKKIETVSSFGGLYYFKPEKAPEGASSRCLGGCKAKEGCPYDAEKIYMTNAGTGVLKGYTGWPTDVLARPATAESIRAALENGPYGRCVFHCDNDVVDHQVVNIEFGGKTTAHLTMSAFSSEIYRTIRIMGTLGDLDGDMLANLIMFREFGKEPEIIDINELYKNLGGHGGGDWRLVDDFLEHIGGGGGALKTSVEKSADSHLAAFAAEESRKGGGIGVTIKKLI